MDIHLALITLGGLFAIGLATDEIGRRTRLPRVTLLILFGVLAGPVGFDLVPPEIVGWYEFLAAAALTMVAFLLGGALSRDQLRRHGREILTISLAVVVASLVVVGVGLVALGVPLALALLLAGIATATAPAATLDVIHQAGVRGRFVETLKGIVAIDDAWGLIAFSLMLIAVNALAGNGVLAVLYEGAREFAGAVAVGAAIGIPAAYLTGRLRRGEPLQAEALAIVFLLAGVSVWLDVSFLIAGVVAGAVVVNFASHHTRAFHEIEHIEWPFMILFFFLAGASLQLGHWREFGAVAVGYFVLRTVSRLAGGWIGATLCAAPAAWRRWVGVALLPQAGVAVGMALVAGDRFPELREAILGVTIATTVAFEIAGPFATLLALHRAGRSQARNR